MTTAPFAADRPSTAPRLRLVGPRPAEPHVGYLVFLPEGVDPTALLAAHGVRPDVHPLGARPAPPATGLPAVTPAATPATGREYGDDALRVDPDQRIAEADGVELDLTYLEFGLLAHLVARPHTVHSRESLVSRVWGYGHVGDGRTVDVHVARLRRKLGPALRDRIVTVRRVGYKYVPARR
ncbi:winged helix-turn-helix domain-containing protein [Streptomyces sp. DH12]|uniref:winged helix-turn-helix domain-containing protein n=1 Tax=Streptomyces sp. DH12 TaxID=2857010 RepID=UPI0027DF7F65|nr:winged helix-turn-helix domain-containing protein [Streptomyces sp. DH12]